MYPVREVGAIASPPPWSAPMVGSSMTSTVLRGSICLESHAHLVRVRVRVRVGVKVRVGVGVRVGVRVGVEVGEPRARRHVGDEHLGRSDDLHASLAHLARAQPTRSLLDLLDAQAKLLLHLRQAVGGGGAAQAAEPGAGDGVVVHPREGDAHVVEGLCDLEVDATRQAAEDLGGGAMA
eukprot:scaffold71583_cov54-Phaeocystis_antarctica.AAC.1